MSIEKSNEKDSQKRIFSSKNSSEKLDKIIKLLVWIAFLLAIIGGIFLVFGK